MSLDIRSPSSTKGNRCRSSFIISNRAANRATKLHSLAEPLEARLAPYTVISIRQAHLYYSSTAAVRRKGEELLRKSYHLAEPIEHYHF